MIHLHTTQEVDATGLGSTTTRGWRWLGWMAVDRAVVLGVLARLWRLATGPVTVLLIAWRFSPELQGYYYAFNSLLALHVLAELGLGTVLVQFASHEWSRLRFDARGRIAGDLDALSRLSSLAQAAWRWYAVAGGLAAIGLGVGGWVFFARQPQAGVDWAWPWLALCGLTGLRLLLVPAWSLLEGCNQVARTYAYRLVQAVLSSLTLWLALLLGARLWVGPAASAVALVWGVIFLWWRYRPFIHSLRAPVQGPRIGWRDDVWPMQWRIAASWLSGYLVFSAFTPILFYFRGPVEAGQMGMTWSLIDALSNISYTFVAARAPRFGALIAQRAYGTLDRLFLKVTSSALVVASLGSITIGGGVYGLHALGHPLAARLLAPAPTAIFLLAMALNQLTFAMAAYLRAHKREPYLGLLVASAILTTMSTLILGSRFGALGVAAGFLAINGVTLIAAAIIFRRRRAEWQAQSTDEG